MTALLSDYVREKVCITDADVGWRFAARTTPIAALTEPYMRPVQTLTLPISGGALNVEFVGDAPSWLEPVMQRLATLLALPKNWDSYGACAVTVKSAVAALRLMADVADDQTPTPSVVPTAQGGVQLEWHQNGIDLEIETISESRFLVAFEDASNNEDWERVVSADLEPIVSALSRLI